MSYSTTGGEMENFDTWAYERGSYQSTPANELIVAVVPGGRQVIGFVAGDPGPCLAAFDPTTLRPTARACGLDVSLAPGVPISPDGRWLLARLNSLGGTAVGNAIGLIDLAAVFDRPAIAGVWADPRGYRATDCVWPDPSTTLCPGFGGLATLRMTAPGAVEWRYLADVPVNEVSGRPHEVVPVPRLGGWPGNPRRAGPPGPAAGADHERVVMIAWWPPPSS